MPLSLGKPADIKIFAKQVKLIFTHLKLSKFVIDGRKNTESHDACICLVLGRVNYFPGKISSEARVVMTCLHILI